MDLGLQGKRALVTGATKGLGRAIAETLLAEGASVSICARTAEDVDTAVGELSSKGKAVGAAVDAADADSLTSWVADSASSSAASTSTSTTRRASRRASSRAGSTTSTST